LTQLLTNLPATPISQISQWLPDNWQRRNLPLLAKRSGVCIGHRTST
jgi:hypothetical protein